MFILFISLPPMLFSTHCKPGFYPYFVTEYVFREPPVTSQLPNTMVSPVLVSLSLLMASDNTDNSTPLDILRRCLERLHVLVFLLCLGFPHTSYSCSVGPTPQPKPYILPLVLMAAHDDLWPLLSVPLCSPFHTE